MLILGGWGVVIGVLPKRVSSIIKEEHPELQNGGNFHLLVLKGQVPWTLSHPPPPHASRLDLIYVSELLNSVIIPSICIESFYICTTNKQTNKYIFCIFQIIMQYFRSMYYLNV